MKMGYYTWRLSTVWKGPRATGFKEKWQISRLEREAAHLTHTAFKVFPIEIKKKHTITHLFNSIFPKFIKNFKKLCENSFKIEANQLSQDIAEIKEEGGIISEIREFWGKIPKNQTGKPIFAVERDFLLKISQEDKDDEQLNREEYKEVEVIINEAKKFGDHQRFMVWLRTRIKKRLNLRNVLEGLSWRRSVSISTMEILMTKKLKVKLRKLLAKISKEINEKNFKKLSAELQAELNLICKDIKNYFTESYLVRERAILTVLKAFYLLEHTDRYLEDCVKSHELPKAQTDKIRSQLNNDIDEVGKKFHSIVSQEFRIVIHDLEKEEREAEMLARAA